MKITNDDGVEIEVYTADEVAAKTAEAVTAKEAEFGKTKTQIEAERDEARRILNERTGEIRQFRKLNDETVAKLSIAERTIYENGLALQESREKQEATEKKNQEALVETAIRAKVGTDEKLVTKVKDMWGLIGIEATTPEQIERKTLAVLGALGATEPDLLASVAGFGGGSYVPPTEKKEGEKTFADSDAGKSAGAALGLTLEIPKK